jgi:hypothetical protein
MIDLESNDDTWIVKSTQSYWDAFVVQVVQWMQGGGGRRQLTDIAHVRHIVRSDTLV